MTGRCITFTAVSIVAAISLAGCASGNPQPDGNPVISPQGTPTGSGGGLTPRGPTLSGTVVRVVDGDTVRVLVDGQREDISVRLIGIDTPETVAPGRPVECFGPEASAFAEQVLDGARVLLELDPSQGETDRYDRTLAYVWVVDDPTTPLLFNLAAVDGGFAEEVTYDGAYTWQAEFIAAEDAARAGGIGRWSACP